MEITLNLLFVTLYWVRVRVRVRGSLGLGVWDRVLELSSVSSILSDKPNNMIAFTCVLRERAPVASYEI